MAEDKVNIGLSVDASKVADTLEETNYFEDRLAIAKFALAYAIRNGLDKNVADFKVGEASGTQWNIADFKVGEAGGTKWNIGSVDSDQYLRTLMMSLYPESETPYRVIEVLMNNGLLAIGEIIKTEGLNKISKLM
jgi:hypothetical protein